MRATETSKRVGKVAGKQIITQKAKTFSVGRGVGPGGAPGNTVDLAGHRHKVQPSVSLTGAAGLGASEGLGVKRKESEHPDRADLCKWVEELTGMCS